MAGGDIGVGAGIGAAIGSVIPGIGNVIGGAIGAVGGFVTSVITSLFNPGYNAPAAFLPPGTPPAHFSNESDAQAYENNAWAKYNAGLPPADPKAVAAMKKSSFGVGFNSTFVSFTPPVPRSGPVSTPPRVLPGGAPMGNAQPPTYGPQPTPPNHAFPGGHPLKKKRQRKAHHARVYSRHRHGSSHLS